MVGDHSVTVWLDGLKGFFWPRHPYPDEAEAARTAGILRTAVERLTKKVKD